MNFLKKSMIIIVMGNIVFPLVYASSDVNLMGRIGKTDGDGTAYLNGVYVSKDTYGMRANAVAAAVLANPINPFNYPIIGVNFLKSLASYQDRDSVGFYADNTSAPLSKWEMIKNVKYSPTSFSSTEIDPSKLKPGMLIDTLHNPKWSSYIVKVSNGKVITSGWVNLSTKHLGTPPDSAGLIVNPVTKIWATNFNITIPEGGRAEKAVLQENGIINNKIINPPSVNGIDTVILPQSKYGGTIAYQSRSATSGNKQQWSIGFLSRGAEHANFYSVDGDRSKSTAVGFLEGSSAVNGIEFSGLNKEHSMVWLSSGKVLAKISPVGQIEKISYKTKIIKKSEKIDDGYARYIVKADEDIKISLPDASIVGDGYTVEIDNFSGHHISLSGDKKVNISKNLDNKITATYVDGEWQIF